jgi:hypothetical protein
MTASTIITMTTIVPTLINIGSFLIGPPCGAELSEAAIRERLCIILIARQGAGAHGIGAR